jgi:hypothetical protein
MPIEEAPEQRESDVQKTREARAARRRAHREQTRLLLTEDNRRARSQNARADKLRLADEPALGSTTRPISKKY